MTTSDDIDKIPLKWQLAPLQRSDIITAAWSDRVGWFYDVGAGKTVCSTVTALLWGCERNYVVVPPIIIDQWETWLHSINEKDVGVYRGATRTEDLLDHKWVVMSHAIFRDSFSTILHNSGKVKSFSTIIDEAQALKNPASKLFKYTKKLATGQKLQLLTGTPTSKPEDSYAYCHLIPNVYRSFGQWQNLHVAEVDFFGKVLAYRDLHVVAANMKRGTFKRTKKEMFGYDLTPMYQVIPYELDRAHERLYCKLAEEQLLLLADGGKVDATTATRLHHALQQIVCNWDKFSGKPQRSAIYDLIDEVVSETDCMDISKSKLIIWTYYKATSAAVLAYMLDKYGKGTGAAAYSDVNSRKGVAAFMTDPNCRWLVAQPSSCGVGAEFQHVCSEMLFIEIATTPMAAKQAIGRVDRKGQVIRPTVRLAQARRTIQKRLFNNLLDNDDLVAKVESLEETLRDSIYGK